MGDKKIEDKKIEITVDQMAEAIAKVMTGEHVSKITKEIPALLLAFTAFGTELMQCLFDKEEEQNKEDNHE